MNSPRLKSKFATEPMRSFFHTLVLVFLFCSCIEAQTDDVYTGSPVAGDSAKRKPPRNYDWMKKLTYEGNLQLQLSNYTFIYLSPTIGYSPIEKVNVGLGVIYNYISINYGGSYGKVSQSVFGGHSYARYFVSDGFFVQGQYDRLRQPNVYNLNGERMKWVDYLLAGVGFRKPIGDRIGMSGTLLYNLTPSPLSIYPSRLIVQFGFMGTF